MDHQITPQEIAQLADLARRFRMSGLYAEAAELLLTALRVAPDDEEMKRALAEARGLERKRRGGPRGLREMLREQIRRDAIDAAHFLGLAHVHAERDELNRATDCLEVARAKDNGNPGPYKLLGRIHFRRREFDDAAVQLRHALRWNPFDREAAELLGRAEFERGRREKALAATVHAYLLVHAADTASSERLRRRVQTLKQILAWGTRDLTRVFHQCQEELHLAFDRLQWRRERFLEDEGLMRAPAPVPAARSERSGGRIGLAARLRRHQILADLTDEQVFQLTAVVHEEVYDAGAVVFQHQDAGRDLFLVGRGELTVQRSTAYGTFTLGNLGPGDLLGEVGFVSRFDRSGDAVASTPLQLYRIDADGLDRLSEEHGELAVQLHWLFWHSLAKKLRSTNAQLQSFFDPGAAHENFLRLRRPQHHLADAVEVGSEDKIRLFREQGLSRKELMTLATFSCEHRFPESAYVFQEGDEGRDLYVILEGRAMICKYIPGGGEEALAILDRGDFFGEMALLDGEPRSADARAYGGPLTVLALGQGAVREVLSLDTEAALEFLRLLCRLLSQRLREIDEKVVGWRILAGGQSEALA